MSIASYDTISLEMEKFSKDILALENYRKILTGAIGPGPFFNEVLKASVENIDPGASYFDVKEDSKISFKAIGDKIKKLIQFVKKMLLKLLDITRSFYVKFSGSIARVRKAQVINSKRLSDVGSKVTNSTITLTNIERLSIDANFKGFDLATLESLLKSTTFFIRDYPKAMVDFVRSSSREILNIVNKPDGNSDIKKAIDDVVFDSFSKTFLKLPSKEKYTLENKSVNRGDFLPGNRCFIFSDGSDVNRSDSNHDDKIISDIIKVDFITVSLNIPDEREKQFKVPPLQLLKDVNNKLGEILAVAEDGEKSKKDFANLKTVAEEAIKEISEKDNMTDSDKSHAIIVLSNIIKIMGKPDLKYLEWLAVTVHVYILLIRKCVEIFNEEK